MPRHTIHPTDEPTLIIRCSCGAPALTYVGATPLCGDCARVRLFPLTLFVLSLLVLTGPRAALIKCACGAIIWPGTTQCAACRKQ